MNTSIALTSFFVGGLLIGNLAVMADRSQRDFDNGVVAKNTTTDEIVVNNTANTVPAIETEVYRVVCVEEKSGYCGAYSVRRIVRE